MSQPSKTGPTTPSAEEDHARVVEMLGSPEMQRRLEEARAQREKILAARKAEGPTLVSPPAAQLRPHGATIRPPAADIEEERAPAIEMLGSAELRKRLEEVQARQARVSADQEAQVPQPSALPAGGVGATVGSVAAPLVLRGSAPMRPPLRAPPRPFAGPLDREGAPALPDAVRPARRRSWMTSLVVGLGSGLVLGVAMMRLAGSAPPWLSDGLDVAGLSAWVGSPTTQGDGARTVPASAISYSVEVAAPPGPAPSDPVPSVPRVGWMRIDRTPNLPRPTSLDVPQVADGATVATATAPVEASPRPPPSLAAPKGGGPVEVVPTSVGMTVLARSSQALAMPASLDRPLVRSVDAPASNAPPGGTGTPTPLDLPPQVVLHLPPSLSQAALYEAQSAFSEAGLDLRSTIVAGFGIAASEVRFFHEADAADAARIAAEIGATARDFSAYRPAPAPGTLEVWLAPEG